MTEREFGQRVDAAAERLEQRIEASADRLDPVSYTHLDVYKRQLKRESTKFKIFSFLW